MEKQNSLLIVDDDASSLMELASILKQDYKIYAVKDGKAALDKAFEAKPDLILLDVVMPGMNGFEVLAELKRSEKTKDIPVMFITGINDSEGEREGLEIGAVDYIRKPFNTMVVKHRVRLQVQIINLQRDLENSAKIAEAANQSKSSFVANMSHEIRTPMNAIMGITDILLQNESRSSDEVAEGLEKIYASSEMLLNIINDILDFSKIEAGKLDILPTKYKIADMINDTIQLNVMRIEDKPITFVLDIDDDIPAKLIGDELRIKQILNNLLSNAFKYTDSGTVTLTVKYEIEFSQKGMTLVLIVQDTGYGMSKEQLDMLFDEYSRFTEETRPNIEGTGLGLSIMRLLVNLMHGNVTVESEQGKGTTVTIRLPQGTVDAHVLGKAAADNLREFKQINLKGKESGKIKREPMPYGKVLIVDDTDTNIFVAVRFMEPYKLQIDTAQNGREAVEIVESGKEYDVIFMDHMMPEMDGMEATKYLRDRGYTAPIVALTANAMTGQAEMFMQNGFDDFISKPIDIRQLDSILLKLIRDKQPQDVIDAAHKAANAPEFSGTIDFKQETDSMLLDSFKSDAQKALAVLDELDESPGWVESESYVQKYITNVHNLKSTLQVVGEDELSAFAKKLEFAGREKKYELIDAETPEFKQKLRDLLERLDKMNATPLSSRKIQGLNITKGLKRFEGDEKGYLKALRAFASGTAATLEDIKTVDESTIAEYKIKVHGIKGASYDMQANEIGISAEDLENAADSGDLDYVKKNNPDFLESVHKLISGIEEMLAAIEAENPKPKKDKPDEELLAKLIIACEKYSMDDIDAVMSELENYQYETDDSLIKKIREHVDLVQFPQIVKLLTE